LHGPGNQGDDTDVNPPGCPANRVERWTRTVLGDEMHQQVLTKFVSERTERYLREAAIDRVANDRETIDPEPRPIPTRRTRAERLRPVLGSIR
jgi:hypothetical protein